MPRLVRYSAGWRRPWFFGVCGFPKGRARDGPMAGVELEILLFTGRIVSGNGPAEMSANEGLSLHEIADAPHGASAPAPPPSRSRRHGKLRRVCEPAKSLNPTRW